MDMPVRERRLNIKFIMEHLEKMQEIQNKQQMVTADKPLISKPDVNVKNKVPNYTSTIKKR